MLHLDMHTVLDSVSMKNKLIFSVLAIIIAALAAVAFLQNREPEPLEFTDIKGVPVYSPPVPLPPVTLTDHNGKPFPTAQFKGQWNVLAFGYTHCPDVCPTTLATLNSTWKQLEQQSATDGLDFYFVSLDPLRDDPATIKAYINHFNPGFIGLTAEVNTLNEFTQPIGVIFEYEGDIAGGFYGVNHYSALVVIDPQARVRAHILPPFTVEKISRVLEKLREYYGK